MLDEIYSESRCQSCGRTWLGSYWGKPLCTECYMEMVADQQERWGERPKTESEAIRLKD